MPTAVTQPPGTRVTTPEGLGTPEQPHPVQQAFLDEQAAQCGYCVNGIIMTTAGLLDADSLPDEERIQQALANHVCRCGTHHRILRAVRRLAGAEPAPCVTCVRRTDLDPAPGGPAPDLPGALRSAPRVEDWLRELPDGRIEVRCGRSELGQGVRTALAQVVAAELALSVDRIVVTSAATDATPDEGYRPGAPRSSRAARRSRGRPQPSAGSVPRVVRRSARSSRTTCPGGRAYR